MSRDLPKTEARDRPENLAVLLREPFMAMSERLHRYFAEHGHPEVRSPHGNVLQYLDDGGTRVSELATRAQITKQSMAELVLHLERHGYVERVPDPSDRRAKLVRATARGGEVWRRSRSTRSMPRSMPRASPATTPADRGLSSPAVSSSR